MWLSTSCYYGIKQYKILHHVLLDYALVYSYVNQSLRHNTGTMMTRLGVEDKRQQQEGDGSMFLKPCLHHRVSVGYLY